MSLPHGSISLDGQWSLTDQHGTTTTVAVPGPWTSQVRGQHFSSQTVIYRREFPLMTEPAMSDRVLLAFGGVNYSAVVRVNGVEVGSHVGGWTPFEFDVTGAVHAGENTIEVVVGYPVFGLADDDVAINEVPHGKQTWYGSGAGIWQSVELDVRPAQYLRTLVVRPHGASGVIAGRLELSRPLAEGDTVEVVVAEASTDEVVAHTTVDMTVGDVTADIRAEVADPVLWSPDAPARYRVTVTVRSATGEHSIQRSIGFRSIETRDGEFLLNGHPLEIRGVLDQDYHPGSSTIPESSEALRALFTDVKRLGFNLVRCHIKRPDRRYYELADELGLLVWTELPSWTRMTDRSATEGRALLEELIELDAHHPSIVIWTVINESWGIDLNDHGQRAWLVDTVDALRSWQPNALVVDNSACEPNFHLTTDIDDYHVYRSIPEGRRSWDAKIADFASRPNWTFSPFGDAQRVGTEPLVLSEYGNWGLPATLDQYDDGEEPWWFATGEKWAFGAAGGTGLLRRFDESGLAEVFGSWAQLIEQLQRAQMRANRYQTGSIRSHASLSGYVITQLSDVQWEANGLFDMNRAPKAGLDDFALMNQAAAVVLRTDTGAVRPGQTLSAVIDLVPPRTGMPGAPSAALLRVRVGDAQQMEMPLDLIERGARTVSITAPAEPGSYEVVTELLIDGEVHARDAAELIVVSAEAPTLGRAAVALQDDLAAWLGTIGVTPSSALHPDSLLVTTTLDRDARRHASGGGRVLVIVEDGDALGDAFNHLPFGSLAPRSGDGDWVPRIDWLRRSGALSRLPGGPIMGLPFEDVIGEWIISDIPAPLRPATVLSGVFSGWLQHPAATTVTMPWSRGEVTITTLRLRDGVESGVMNAAVARALLEHAGRS